MTRRISILLAAVVFLSRAHAQQADDAYERLVSATSLRCELTKGTQASWDSGDLTLAQSDSGASGEVTFDSINHKRGTARLIANAGATDVKVMASSTGLTFVEKTDVGNWNFTTVFAHYDAPGSRRFVVVESRHTTLSTLIGPFPSQYYGSCVVLE